MKILVHACCGPCFIHPSRVLRAEDHEIVVFAHNPNIQPYTEYLIRLDTLNQYCLDQGIRLIEAEYDFYEYMHRAAMQERDRCSECYSIRLDKTADRARTDGYDSFTTTLLVSPYQKHDLIRAKGDLAAQKYGIPFIYIDFRPGYRQAMEESKRLNMYRQKYCGCIFSEKDKGIKKKSRSL